MRRTKARHKAPAPVRTLRRIAAGRDPQAAFYLALAYFLWAIIPHFHVLVHSHAGGAHSHAALSGAQVRLANRLLDGLGPAGLAGSADGDIGGQETSASGGEPRGRAVAPVAGETAMAAGNEAHWHAHYWEDANLAGAASLPIFALACAAALLYFAVRYLPPALGPSGSAPARGPPAFASA
jgi:hypothetical protein